MLSIRGALRLRAAASLPCIHHPWRSTFSTTCGTARLLTTAGDKRQVALDTETTGLCSAKGDRLLEIGDVELMLLIGGVLTGNNFHQYINPQRSSHPAALKVHCITDTFLEDKPVFADIRDEFLNYITGAELLIYNTPFDLRLFSER